MVFSLRSIRECGESCGSERDGAWDMGERNVSPMGLLSDSHVVSQKNQNGPSIAASMSQAQGGGCCIVS